MRFGKGGSLSSEEGASKRCEYEIRNVGDSVELIVKCQRCDGKADLMERVCRNGVLDILLEEPVPNSIILSGFAERLYEDDAMDLIQRLTDLLRKTTIFGKRNSGRRSERCSTCKRSPAFAFNRIERAFKKNLPAFRREVRIQSSSLSARQDSCKSCVESTRRDLHSLWTDLGELRGFVLRRAFRISTEKK